MREKLEGVTQSCLQIEKMMLLIMAQENSEVGDKYIQ